MFGVDDALLMKAGEGILGGLGSMGQANAQADEARRQQKLQRLAMDRAYGQQERRYTEGLGQEQSGENALMSSMAQAPAELGQFRKDVAAGNTLAQQQAMGQARLTNAQQGISGGQAATLLNRQSGTMNQDLNRQLNEMSYNDAVRRQGITSGYQTQKALGGQRMAGSV